MPLSTGLLSWFASLKGDGSVIKEIGNVIDKNIVSKREIEEKILDLQMEELQTQRELALGQIEVNKVEAAHPSVFVAGWRPFIGWVCGGALAYNFVFRSMIEYCIVIWAPGAPNPPALEMEHLMTIVLAMLGTVAARSWDKWKGVQTDRTKF